MNDQLETRLSMYTAVRDFIAANETALTALPGFTTLGGQFGDVVSQIRSIKMEQRKDLGSVALNKAEVREALITRAYSISRKILAITVLADGTNFRSEIDYTKSELRNSTDSALEDICGIIAEHANTIQPELETFNVTATMIEDFQALVNTFSEAIPKPKNAASEHKLTSERLKTLFEEGDSLLKNKIDILLSTIEEEDINLFKAYRSARTLIREYGSRKRAVKVNITDTAGTPIRNVDATVVGSPITKKTADKGCFYIDSMPAGVYTFNFSTPGYKPETATVIVRDGELARVNVVMESILENVSV